MARFLSPLYEACLIVLAAFLGRLLTNHVRVIPASVVRLPVITYTEADFVTVLIALGIVCGAVFLATALIKGANLFSDARRMSVDMYALILGFTLATVYLYLFGNIIFSPELIAGTFLVAFVLFVLTYAVGNLVFGRRRRFGLIGALFEFAGSTVLMLRSPAAIAIVLLAVSPVIAAKVFTTNRDFANFVTRVRLGSANANDNTKYQLTSVFPGVTFLQPIDLEFSPDRAPFLYVLERGGRVWRIGTDGRNKDMLIDFSSQIGPTDAENGAVGMALHPEFGRADSPNRGFAYVYFSDATTPGKQTNRLVRFDLSLSSPADRAASEIIIIEFDRDPGGFHNAGGMLFGRDGFLYIALGEAQDTGNRQRIDGNPVGGIWRIDVDQRGGAVSHPIPRQPKTGRSQSYFIPNDNPFVGRPNSLEEYWALGLRNPFRFSFDPQTGDIWAGDVGSEEWEEVDFVQKAGNYQYPYIEGESPMARQSKPAQFVGEEHGPVYFYHHTVRDRAVIGGEVYVGDKWPELKGQYIFADGYSGRILSFPANQRRVAAVSYLARSIQVAQFGVVKLTNSPDGDFYVLVLGALSQPTGEIMKLVSAGSAPPQTVPHPAGTQVAVADGREIFSANCARCHGPKGDGDSPEQANLPVKAPNFTDPAYASKRTLAEMEDIIRKGGASAGLNPVMPPWGEVLSANEIRAVATYVRGLSGVH
jgi:glucose/arabinose dehydrogenase/mono/diheme cytochrome c family protein